jgi:magnesium chelatase subunit D
VNLSDAALLKIAEVCAAFEVDGLRADIVTARTAVAHAAWEGRSDVTRADIRRAALLALPHRRRRNPFDAPGLDEELLDQVLGDEEPPPDPPSPPSPPEDPGTPGTPEPPDSPDSESDPHTPDDTTGPETEDPGPEDAGPPDTPEDNTPVTPGTPESNADNAKTITPGTPYRPRLLSVRGLGQGTAGHRSRALSETGHRVGAERPRNGTGSLHLVETLYASARRPRSGSQRPRIEPEDLRVAIREGREANLVLFCVDASGSMAARKRMRQVKTAILSLLLDAYRRRDKVGLVTFRKDEAQTALPPTHSVDIAAKRLAELPAGGRTPLAEGLLTAAQVLIRERRRDPRLRPLLVIVTDGRATSGQDAVARSQQAAGYLAQMNVTTVVIDGEDGPLRLGLAAALAERLHAEHIPVAEVSAETLTTTVREHTRGAA